MIKGISLRKVEITEQEYGYYLELEKQYSGLGYFDDLFETNDNGIIQLIKTTKSIPWSVLFFVQNLMINQHLRQFDGRITDIEKKLGDNNEQ